MFMVCHRELQLLANLFESVTKHAVTKVMNGRRSKRLVSLVLTVVMPMTALFHVALDNPHQVASGMKDPNAMRKSTVRRAWIDKFREAQLLDPAQTLKRRRLDHLPHNVFKLARSKLD